MSLPREHRAFAAILAVSLVARLAFAFSFPIVQVSDYAAYYSEARVLAGLTPGSPSLGNIGPKLFYAFAFRVMGDDLRVIAVANLLVYAAALVLLYLATYRIFGRSTAIAVGLVSLASVSEIFFINLACSEILAAFFMGAMLFVLSREPSRFLLWTQLGLVAGLGAYVRSNTLGVFALVFAYRLWRSRRIATSLGDALGVQIIALLITLPLAMVHWHFYGRLSPVAPGSPENLWYGNNPKLRGDLHSYTQIPEDLPVGGPRRKGMVEEYRPFYVNPIPDVESAKLDAYSASELKMRYGMGWIRNNPRRYAELIGARFRLIMFHCTFGVAGYLNYDPTDRHQPTWSQAARFLMFGNGPARTNLNPDAPIPATMKIVDRWYQVLAVLSLAGLLATIAVSGRHWLGSREALPLFIAAWYIGPFLLTLGLNRYKVPMLGMCWIYLAHGLVLGSRRLRAAKASVP